MAETDESSKTEEPTSRRLQQGRERGQVAVSQDVKVWGSLVGTVVVLASLVPPLIREAFTKLLPFIEQPEAFPIEAVLLPQALRDLMLAVGAAVAPILGLMAALAIGLGVVQVGLLWAPDKIAPKPSHLSPLAGVKRIFSLTGLAEFAKGLLKIGVVTVVFLAVAIPLMPHLEGLAAAAPAAALGQLHDVTIRFAASTAAVIAVLAVVDYLFQRQMFLKQMRMTRQEVRDEHRDSEGDPQIKGRIRQLRVQRSRQRMMAAVPQSDVVITNPTHFAVALKYDMETMAAPKLVAKGADLVARRIRELAEAHGVPIVENPPLARALHGNVEIDAEIPPAHYEAVAAVIGYVMRLKQAKR